MPRCVARVATFEFQRGKQDVAVRFVYFAGAPDKIQVVVDGHVVRQHDNAKGNRKPCITHARELVEYYFEGRPQRRKATGPRLKVVGGEHRERGKSLMSIKTKSQKILREAQDLACRVKSWADFSNRMFDPSSGVVAKEFPQEIERQAFYDTEEYSEVNKLFADLMRKFGVSNGSSTHEKSGRFLVRVPKTVHQKLEIEARHEGISLNQLAVSKLAIPLKETFGMSDEQ